MDFVEKYINPFTDYGFKRLFGEEPSKELLLDFLNELLQQEQGRITSLTYLKSDRLGSSEEDRRAIFDLYCENERGEKFIVELQKTKQKFFKDRTVYYSTFPIREQAQRGSDWNFELNAVYTVAILDFVFDEDKAEKDKYRYDVKLTDIETCKVFYDKLTFIYLEMPKFNKPLTSLTSRFDKWMYVLRNLNKLNRVPDELREEIFLKLFELAEIARFSSKEAEAYEESLKSYRDLKNSLDTAREEGKAEGIAQGREEGREEGIELVLEVIGLSKSGKSVAEIATQVGISAERVTEILRRIK
ncbi:Rpn family recombination-promoting nuclease/putative transposase [Rhodoflexus sp.]